jgi:glycine betaine/choline ABC-type transport system substrate-binding protein
MKCVRSYYVAPLFESSIQVPRGGTAFCVFYDPLPEGQIRLRLCIAVDDSLPVEERKLFVLEDDQDFQPPCQVKYVGTVRQSTGNVFHVLISQPAHQIVRASTLPPEIRDQILRATESERPATGAPISE